MQRSIKIKGSVMKRFSMYVSGLLFLLGCSDLFPRKPPPQTVSHTQPSLISVQCPDVSLDICSATHSSCGSSSSRPGLSSSSGNKLSDLKVGTTVQISGSVEGGPCFDGRLSFSCSGVVRIRGGRKFACQSGTFQEQVGLPGFPGVAGSVSPPSSVGGVGATQQSFSNGEFDFSNGKLIYMGFSAQKNVQGGYVPPCKVSANCE